MLRIKHLTFIGVLLGMAFRTGNKASKMVAHLAKKDLYEA